MAIHLRRVAAGVLTRVIKNGQSLTVALEQAFESISDKKDRAFIQALCYGVMRQYHRLDFILQQLLRKPLRAKDTDISMLMLIGLYQLKYMRVKTHAAVSETVSAASKKTWAKSLINGVLRQYMREQEQLEHKADQSRAILYSHPQWLIDEIEKDWPEQVDQILQANNCQPPMTLRVNLAQSGKDDYLKQLTEHSIQAKSVLTCSSAIELAQAVNVEKLPGFAQGTVSVQDAAAQLAATLLEVQAGHAVLDMCAAPGGKTAAIIEQVTAPVSMLAVDIDETRLASVKDNLQRLKLQAKLIVGDATKPGCWANGQVFDRILVDAPCSALGVIRRHPDIKVLRRKSDILELQLIQKKILEAAWSLLAPRGIMLYATCSILKQENELQIASFLDHHEDASEIEITAEWGVKATFGRQVFTGALNMDGFYYAKLIKN